MAQYIAPENGGKNFFNAYSSMLYGYPASWDTSFVGWSNDGTENRVVSLALHYSEADSDSIAVTDFSGTMDVSKLTSLSSLMCGMNPGLTKLILPESGSLDTLRCHDTGITELDLSNNPALEVLDCSNTRITALDLSAEFALSERLLLTALAIEGVQLSPAFSGNVYHYTASVGHDVAQINIQAQGNDRYELNINGNGIHPLKVGTNTFVVTVIVPIEQGISDINNPDEPLTNNYTITVTRAENSGSESDPAPEPTPTQEPVAASELDDVPKTGDNSHVGVWFGLMMIGIVTLTASAVMWHQSKRMK